MSWFHQEKNSTITQLEEQLAAVKRKDPEVIKRLSSAQGGDFEGLSQDEKLQFLGRQIEASIKFVKDEEHRPQEIFNSRDPLGGLLQSLMNDNVLPQLQGTGQGNPVTWIPAGIDALIARHREKYPFKEATERSRILIPNKCKIALLADWGADNDHAKRIGDIAIRQGADYVIHLGDIYYAGAQSECEAFVKNWPLKDAAGNPLAGRSFALNGNHEMYSMGKYYFTTVLSAFSQEASYFTLYNDAWQLQGLDTAYVPFTIDGGGSDNRLQVQWKWLTESIDQNPTKRNIFLTHNQPVSAHIPEYTAASTLMDQWWKLAKDRGFTFAFAWFFGHEHRCTIYDDLEADGKPTNFKARLIGSGAIPHLPQHEKAAEVAANGASTTRIWRVNGATIGNGLTASSSFAILSLDGPSCTVEYIDENEAIFYKEDLTAGPNHALDGL